MTAVLPDMLFNILGLWLVKIITNAKPELRLNTLPDIVVELDSGNEEFDWVEVLFGKLTEELEVVGMTVIVEAGAVEVGAVTVEGFTVSGGEVATDWFITGSAPVLGGEEATNMCVTGFVVVLGGEEAETFSIPEKEVSMTSWWYFHQLWNVLHVQFSLLSVSICYFYIFPLIYTYISFHVWVKVDLMSLWMLSYQ